MPPSSYKDPQDKVIAYSISTPVKIRDEADKRAQAAKMSRSAYISHILEAAFNPVAGSEWQAVTKSEFDAMLREAHARATKGGPE